MKLERSGGVTARAEAAVDDGFLPDPSKTVTEVVHYGLGPIGLAVAALVARRRSLRSVGAVDVDPEIQGKDLGELCGMARLGLIVSSVLPAVGASGAAPVAVHCTGSSLTAVAPQLLELIGNGFCVVSTCEELSYPWDDSPEVAARLDQAARVAGVSVLGTGVNPGFAMDYLPLVLTAIADEVDAVHVHRVQNASERRVPLQQKVGAGISTEEFERRRADGGIGHVGLRESARAVAAGLGWQLERLEETLLPAVADRRLEAAFGVVEPGEVAGIDQTVVGYRDGRPVIRMRLEMALGRDDARDVVRIESHPPVEMTIPGGLHGDRATASVVVNAIDRVRQAPFGLRVMADLGPPRPRG